MTANEGPLLMTLHSTQPYLFTTITPTELLFIDWTAAAIWKQKECTRARATCEVDIQEDTAL